MPSANLFSPQEVSIFGTDASGKPFFHAARVISIDGFEVTLDGVQRPLEINDIVGLLHQGQRARFQVVGVGYKESPQKGQVTLRALELQKNLFGVSGSAAPGQDSTLPVGRERRQHARISCHGTVVFRREDTDLSDAGALRLLSEGGCYIKTAATAPPLSRLDLAMSVEGLELRTQGQVQASQPGFGMGIAFGEMNPASRARLHHWTTQRCKS